jgi:glutathione S-transferase
MLKLYGCPNTRSMRAAWALEEAQAEYEYQPVPLLKGGGRRPSFLRVNPSGKVPVLADDDFILTESVAICTYIGDLFPQSGLTPPAGTKARARYNQWMAFAVAELEQPLWTIAKHRFALPKELRVPAAEEGAKWDFGRACRVLDKGIAGREYILGESFSAADILLAHTLAWAVSARIPIESAAVEAYSNSLLARPAVARAKVREAQSEPEDAT